MSKCLKWECNNHDAKAAVTTDYTVERAGPELFWAFADGRPLGTYATQEEAKARCEEHFSQAPSPVQKRVEELEAMLREVRDNGLIYWEPNTARGDVRKAEMMARIGALLSDSKEG